jgi:flagellar hook assembly protein FlgD
LVRTLLSGKVTAGLYTAVWDGKDSHGRQAASGAYYFRLDADDFSSTQKVMLIK